MPENQEAVNFSNPSLLYSLAWTLIEQKERQRFRIWGQEFTREQCLYEIYRHLSSYLPDLKIKDFHQLDDEKLLKDFSEAVLEVIKGAVPQASRPATERLQVLVEEYRVHLEEVGQREELRKELSSENLQAQLEKIRQYYQFQEQIKAGVKKEISPFYAEEFKEQVAEEVAVRLFQETATQVKAIAPTDEVFVRAALEKVFQESREADIAFSSEEKEALAKVLIRTVASEELKTSQLVEGYLAQTELIQTSQPKRPGVIEEIARTTSLEANQAREVLNKAETLRLKTNQPTGLEVREVLKQALESYETLPTEKLTLRVQHYLAANPVSQPQNQPFPSFISRQALRVSQKLQVAPTTVQDALDGLSSKLKVRSGISEAQRQLFSARIERLRGLETTLAETSGFRFLKLRIAWNQRRAQLSNLFDENNPLSPVFYPRHFPDLRNEHLERRKFYQSTRDYLKNTSPLRIFFAPRQEGRNLVGGWWQGLLARSQTFSNFANFLPKLKPSYFIGRKLGGFLVRKGASWAAETGIKALGGRALSFVGTKLLGRAAGSAIGTAIGGPLGTVAGMAAGVVLEKVWDKGKTWIKRAATAGAAALGLLFFKAAGLLFGTVITGLSTVIGAGVGFLLGGPIGALVGAGAGAGLGHFLGGLLGKGAAAQAASSTIASTNALLSAPAAATVSGPVAAASVVAVGATAVLTVTTITAQGGAFLPLEVGGGIDAPKQTVITPECDHAACEILAQLESCGISEVNRGNFSRVKSCLAAYPRALEEFERSVGIAGGGYNLQCVGFKIGVEKEEGIGLPYLNAVSFLYASGCEEVTSPEEISVGHNAVWGPRSSCPTQNPEEANKMCGENIYCCGHIGVITGVGDYLDSDKKTKQITVTQAWGNNGQVNSITTTNSKAAGGAWKILKCD